MTATDDALDLTRTAARAAWDKSGEQIVAFDVSEQLAIADVFLVVSAGNERLVGALVDAVEEALLRVGRKPLRREGNHEQRWVLLDYGDLVVHVQHSEERVLYNLERLWKDCPVVDLQLPDA
ncbi:ribosome silencing factor [uncultured Tessaracoccus sp.]|uniref:ribosome silencing factor n=1 Tax=uncultured Tessaracoccus sp. TaxID=905023 RepID=UPI0025ED9BC6|nr:ribosome silencing factor [uncultured Tessaracoccus sp.]